MAVENQPAAEAAENEAPSAGTPIEGERQPETPANETPEAEEAVRKAGVDYGQGWLYGRAADKPADAATWTPRGSYREGALAIRSALDRAEN